MLTSEMNTEDILDHEVQESTTEMSLHQAVKERNEATVIELLNLKPMHEYGTDEEGNTALHIAAHWKNRKILNLLINVKGPNPFINTKNNKGQTPLFCFTKAHNFRAINILVTRKDIDVDAAETETGNSPFIASMFHKSVEAAIILHNCGANINLANNKNFTALHLSVFRSREQFIKLLLEWKANVNCQNEHGVTPLIFAVMGGKLKLVQLLITHGADVKFRDHNKWTALHHAVKRNQIDIVTILLEHKADVDSKTGKDYTPLMLACSNNRPDIVEVLLNHNANISLVNCFKLTALQICQTKRFKECQAKVEARQKPINLGPVLPAHMVKKLNKPKRNSNLGPSLSVNWSKKLPKKKQIDLLL